jgi:D-alanyl-lipoteichoic acid acyltransferase DltB (MBOAT superfamily)
MVLVGAGQSPITAGEPRVLIWSLTLAFVPYLWFLAYALGDLGTGQQAPSSHFLGVLHPFWANSPVPFGKGVTYLRKFEATTPAELAVTQLKAVKLALWAVVLAMLSFALAMVFHQYLAVPQYDDVFSAFVAGNAYPWPICWLSLIDFYLHDVLTITIIGAIFIAYARMAGFRLLRNTYKPLAATTIADFWNRYFYYYKELLVDNFFYPTFFLCFRKHPKLRMFFATFMAACVGNLFFHFAMDIHFVPEMGWRRALLGEESHAFYTLLLALGIGLSQMRNLTARRAQKRLPRRLLAFAGVALFFCVIHVFDAPEDRDHSLWQRQQFLVHLSGLDRWI